MIRIVLIFICLIIPMVVRAKPVVLTQQRQWFQAAEKALQKGNQEHFESQLAKLGNYPLVPFLRYRFYLKYPHYQAQIAYFLQQYADTRYARPVRAGLLQWLAGRQRWRDYVWFYQDLGKPALHCHYAWALYRLGQPDEAWQEARRLWLVGHSQAKSCDRVFTAWRKAGKLNADLIWQRFELALADNKTRLAEYLAQLLSHPDRARARFWLRVHRHPESFACARWPHPFQSDGQIFSHGVKRLALTDLNKAIRWWQSKAVGFKLTPVQQANVQRFIGLRLAWRHDSRAWAWLSEVPKYASDEKVQAWRARAAIREQNWTGVAQAVLEMPVPDRGQIQWRYWQTRALSHLQGEALARPLYQQLAKETDYYGFLAADKLRKTYRIRHQSINASKQSIQVLKNGLTFHAIQEFMSLGREWEARREWWYLLNHVNHSHLLAAAELAQRMEWPHLAIFAVARAEKWDDLTIRFPLRFLSQVRKYANATHLDAAYVFGIIRRESAFDEHAHSPVGARGLMQLMPQTARKVARQLHERSRVVNRLEDASTNVRYGTTYFRSLLERFDGNFVLATAAYNAGPHRVVRWLPERALPADIWIETIPFRETRRYVRAVLAYTMIYQHRLQQGNRRLSDYAQPIFATGRPRSNSRAQLCGTSF